MGKKRGIDEMLKELEQMAAEMEGGDLTLEESFGKYESAMKLIKEVSASLKETEEKVVKLQGDGEVAIEE